jgi:hypothetical protein
MEANQTAVDWLIDKVEDHFCLLPVELIEQAKEMEKDQHGLTFARGYMTGYAGANGHGSVDFDKYYEKEYGK